MGNAGIAKVGDFLSSKYESVLPKIKVSIDDAFRRDMGELASFAQSLPADRAQQFVSILKNELVARGLQPGQVISGESMKLADTNLGRIAASYRGSIDPDQRALGTVVRQAQENLRDMVARQNPDTAPIVQAANEGWRTLDAEKERLAKRPQ